MGWEIVANGTSGCVKEREKGIAFFSRPYLDTCAIRNKLMFSQIDK